jgi:hypothetical protein
MSSGSESPSALVSVALIPAYPKSTPDVIVTSLDRLPEVRGPPSAPYLTTAILLCFPGQY